MGFFSFHVDFDASTHLSKEESYSRLLNYLQKRRYTIVRNEAPNSILFRTKTSLLSWPRDFNVTFIAENENKCNLKVHVDCGQCDLGLSKLMFNDITKKIYENKKC